MVGIDIYEVEVTIAIQLGYHWVDEAEKIASALKLAIGEATDSKRRRGLVANNPYDVTGYMR